jgi:hypothetical protein
LQSRFDELQKRRDGLSERVRGHVVVGGDG